MDFYEILQNHAAVFLLVLVRISGIFIMAPFLGSINIPQYVRVGTAIAISIVMFPSVDASLLDIVGYGRHGSVLSADEGRNAYGSLVSLANSLAV
ncbi:MAG: flagellar biosynthetic protein FliR [Schwartzia sp.]|nr:flagellar biosynthetic protein FliR [Schwartzia sp. (in: firmicutes)]